MQRRSSLIRQLIWTGLGFLASVCARPAAQADEPWLSVRLTGGGTGCYPADSVDRVGFVGDTLAVFWANGSDRWPLEGVVRIEFLWSPANSASPHDAAALAKTVRLFQNQPNPFSPATRIVFDLPQSGIAALGVYNAGGRQVRSLVWGVLRAGRHELEWDGRDDVGRKVASGLYFYQLTASGVKESRRMVVMP